MNSPENDPTWWKEIPLPVRQIIRAAASLVAGVLVAVLLHYLLYRVGLPSKPFIYVAF